MLRLFNRIRARLASWYVNANIKHCYTKSDILELELLVAISFCYQYVTISTYSYTFRTKRGVFIYSRCNGKIYFFEE